MLFLLFVVLGLIEVAFALYGRNVIMAAAHEGARAAVELGRDPDHGSAVASTTVRKAAGGLVDDLDVSVASEDDARGMLVTVRVTGVLDAFGPIPLPLPVTAQASARGPLVTR